MIEVNGQRGVSRSYDMAEDLRVCTVLDEPEHRLIVAVIAQALKDVQRSGAMQDEAIDFLLHRMWDAESPFGNLVRACLPERFAQTALARRVKDIRRGRWYVRRPRAGGSYVHALRECTNE